METNWTLGLKAETLKVFEPISQMECIRGLYLCGGTAQSLQMAHRKSEDLEFELIGNRKERPLLNFASIINEVTTLFPSCRKEFLSQSHFQLFVDGGVKLSFFRPTNPVPMLNAGLTYNNIVTPTLQELLGMKLFTITIRSEFRDFYDIYCLLKEGYDLAAGVDYACRFTRHTLHSKYIYAVLLNEQYFIRKADFDLLDPVYDVTPHDIVEEVKHQIEERGIIVKK